MRVSVIVFPGSNCDHDVVHAFGDLLGHSVSMVWHRDTDLQNPDLVVLPGGFAYGDYLRTGALAKVSPAMAEVRRYVAKGGRVLGICNGFQILCEVELLPGVLLQNSERRFLSQFVSLRVDSPKSFITAGVKEGTVVTCPIAHGEGNYYADNETLKRLEGDGRVVFRYCDEQGTVDPSSRISNPNGSAGSIAGISNESGTVVGLMPHPERSLEKLVGGLGAGSCMPLLEHCSLR